MRLATCGSWQRKWVHGLSSTIRHRHLHLPFRMVLKLVKQFHMSTFTSFQGGQEILRKMMKSMMRLIQKRKN
ncbi:hypothetical protein QOZ80_5BG0426480 [Eleusine coracana subsp. coracana]|nr:hypothetical protein QOZ80_5BG0426480 [Eleusine coracana subsp. coracana]